MDIVCVTVDCRDPERVARFWSQALEWPAPRVAPDGSGATCHPGDGGTYLEFVRVREAKQSKNRLHVGCTAGPIEAFDAEVDRLVTLGAEVAWKEVFGDAIEPWYRNWVLRDPEGNEFCLGGGRWPDGIDGPAEVRIEPA